MVDVDDASTGIAQMAQGPSKYLVLAANNAEMRAGSGMLLSAGRHDDAERPVRPRADDRHRAT